MSCMFEGSFIRLLLLDGRRISVSCIYCSGISDLKEAVRNGWCMLMLKLGLDVLRVRNRSIVTLAG